MMGTEGRYWCGVSAGLPLKFPHIDLPDQMRWGQNAASSLED